MGGPVSLSLVIVLGFLFFGFRLQVLVLILLVLMHSVGVFVLLVDGFGMVDPTVDIALLQSPHNPVAGSSPVVGSAQSSRILGSEEKDWGGVVLGEGDKLHALEDALPRFDDVDCLHLELGAVPTPAYKIR